MSRTVVAITQPFLGDGGFARLAGEAELRVWRNPEHSPNRDELAAMLRDADAVITGGVTIDDAVLAGAPRLRIIALPAVGYDTVDVAAANRRGIVVTNAPGVLHETTADLTFALILMARRLLLPAVDAVRAGEWTRTRFDARLGLDVHGATLGLIGYGEIGQAVARRAAGFGMSVLHCLSSKATDRHSRAATLDDVLSTSDIVSLHVPLTEDTRGLLGRDRIAMMKPTATLINTARGGLVDEEAMLDALDAGALHSAGLDVAAGEPLSDAAHPLLHNRKVVVLPHVGSATAATRAAMVDVAVTNVLAVLAGEPPLTPVAH